MTVISTDEHAKKSVNDVTHSDLYVTTQLNDLNVDNPLISINRSLTEAMNRPLNPLIQSDHGSVCHFHQNPLIFPSLIQYLDDGDVMIGWLGGCKQALNQIGASYIVKQDAKQKESVHLTKLYRLVDLKFSSLMRVTKPFLSPFTWLRHIYFDLSFNKPLLHDMLPDGLLTIHLGRDFNFPILPGVLPSSITSIHLSENFDQPLDVDVLPQSLISLVVGSRLRHVIKPHVLPCQLKTLTLSLHSISCLIPGTIPSSVDTIIFSSHVPKSSLLPGIIPSSVQHIRFQMQMEPLSRVIPGSLPSGLKYLHIPVSPKLVLVPRTFPDTLEQLVFATGYNNTTDVGVLPASLKHLTMCDFFSKQLFDPGVLPPNLEHLNLLSGGPPPLMPGVLPVSLKHFTAPYYKGPLTVGSLPSQLTYLDLSERFDHPLSVNELPSTLLTLKLDKFCHPLYVGVIPNGVTNLSIAFVCYSIEII